MQCPRCQHDNPDRAKFCLECGTRLALTCGRCRTELPPSAKFCLECGEPAEGLVSAGAEPASRFASPETYTPRHLAERIISSRGALEGERKQVTVLFADLKGSMELLADRDPEDAHRILDPVLERMMEAVHRYEGTVNQVMGDGIMALFGAPLAHEDHAVRACYAALRMQESVKEYAEAVRRTEGTLVQIRVGLNSGEVVVRSIGSDLRMDYTAVGQTTHLAARMEQLAAPGSVLLAPATLRLVEGYVQVKALGPMVVKGLGAPVDVYELVAAGTARSRLQAAVVRGLTRFVGRDAELETLRHTLELAGGGHGQIAALVGEPGVGKSRLVWEFSHSHRTQGWLVLASGSVSYGKATSYLPIIDLLKSYCGIEDRDDARRTREKLTGKVLTLDPALQPTLPALLALLDVPVEDASWQALDPPQRRQRTLDALKRLLLRESVEQPLLLVCEDLHWMDAETQALLDSLVESLPTARLLMLVNYRPEYEHGWHRKTYYQQVRLDPLPPENAEELLAALLGDAVELAPLKQVLIARTEGNPFFVEESVRTLLESGVLAGERGAYRLARPFESTQVPATVQAVLAARIDRLAPEAKRLLQAAAVIGKDVPYALLQAIAELPEDALREGLARLHSAELLYEVSLFPDLQYTFKHALTHEVAYGSLLHERRRALHAQIMQAIETHYEDRLMEQVERLAHHAVRGEVWPKAVLYCRQAGAKAAARSSYRVALTHFEQALAALGHLAERRETREEAIDLRLDLRNCLWPLGEFWRMFDYLREAETLAVTLEDRPRLAHVLVGLQMHAWLTGDARRAIEYSERAHAIAQELADPTLISQATHRLGNVYCLVGDYRRASMLLQESLANPAMGVVRTAPALAPAAARAWLAWCAAEQGEFARGLVWGEEGLRRAEEANHPFSVVVGCWGLGCLHLIQGVAERAIAILERGVAVAQEWDVAMQHVFVTTALGYAYVLAGRNAEGLPLLEQGVAEASRVGLMREHARRIGWLAEACLRAGHEREAFTWAERAILTAQQHLERGHEAYALRLMGEIVTEANPAQVGEAESYYSQALSLANELGMRPLAAHCHLGLGTLYLKINRREQAQAELSMAAEMYRAMEMTFWLARAEAALASLGQP